MLLSGGLDSATVLALARAAGRTCYALSVDYGQRPPVELDAAAVDLGGDVDDVVLHLGVLGRHVAAAAQPEEHAAGDQHRRDDDDKDQAQEAAAHQAHPPAFRSVVRSVSMITSPLFRVRRHRPRRVRAVWSDAHAP